MASLTRRIADTASAIFLTSTKVSAVERLTERFVRIELTADAFRGKGWVPGQKLQLRPEQGGFGMRTYTPTRWDPEAGSTELLAFVHGDGPAATWVRSVAVDQACGVFGPRGSIDLRDLSRPVVFVGDETSVGLAVALHGLRPADVARVFESTRPDELEGVLAALDLPATVVAKDDDRSAVRAAVRAAVPDGDLDLVLTGDAATIADLRRDVKTWDHAPTTTKVKAYWAEGRTGLD